MLDRLFGTKVHHFIYLFSLVVIAIGMSFGKAILSIGMVLMIINFFLEFKLISAFRSIKGNIPLLFLLFFFGFYMLAVLWSIDFYHGLSDIKSRLPLIVIPIIIGTRIPLTEKELSGILHIFLASIILSTIINFLTYTSLISDGKFIDTREMSLFGSHIRFGLVIALGIAVSIWYTYKLNKLKLVYLIPIAWLLFYTYYSQVLSGYLAIAMLVVFLVFYRLWKWNKAVAMLTLACQFILCMYFGYQFLNFTKKPADIDSLPTRSAQGNFYYHTNEEFSELNGLPIRTYIVFTELKKEWSKRSKLDFEGLDEKNHDLVSTILRYMTALELTKDSVGMHQLSNEDIRKIECGFTYPDEEKQPFRSRMNGLRYQLLNEKSVNGHSLLQRFEYWKTSIYLIKRNGVFGVGTGGNQKAFDEAYIKTKSVLDKDHRCRSHNMFFSVIIGQGILGIFLFLIMLFVLIRTCIRTNFLLGTLFLVIIIPSFLIEDTLETQLGVTIFGFFTALILSEYNNKKAISSNS